MRKLLATIALGAAALAVLPARAENVLTPFYPGCQGGATFSCTDVFIQSFDGTNLDATLYVPLPPATTPAPAVLMTHGYGGWHRGGGDMAFQRFLASNGYVVLAYTSRGFGRSSGTVQLQSPDYEVRDAQRLITWLADSSGGAVVLDAPGDPRVGMVGGSYAGGIQLLTAARDMRLDAITPQITWNDLRYSLSPNGVTKHGWIDLLYASGKYSGYLGPIGTVPPPVVGTDGVPADQDVQVLTSYLTNENVELPAGLTYSDGSTSSYEYLERRSPVYQDVIDAIGAPAMLIQGQRDTLFTMNEAVANMEAIADNAGGVPTKLVMFSGGHGYPDLAGERGAINARILTWFDRYLRGNALADTGPRVELWQPWVSGQNFAGMPALPAPGPAIDLSGVNASMLVNTVAATSHTEIPNFQNQTGAPSADAVATTFAIPLASGTRIAGIPVVRFTLTRAVPAPEAIVFAKLVDVDDASGARTIVHHLVTPARVRGGVGDFCSGYIPGPAGVDLSPVDVCLPLAGVVWRVEPGHHLELALTTTDSMFFGSRFPGVYLVDNVSIALPTL